MRWVHIFTKDQVEYLDIKLKIIVHFEWKYMWVTASLCYHQKTTLVSTDLKLLQEETRSNKQRWYELQVEM